MSQYQDYQEIINETIEMLEQIENEVFTGMVNLGMGGVYTEIAESFEVGDSYDFELEMFEDTSDNNLNVLVKLVKHIRFAQAKLITNEFERNN